MSVFFVSSSHTEPRKRQSSNTCSKQQLSWNPFQGLPSPAQPTTQKWYELRYRKSDRGHPLPTPRNLPMGRQPLRTAPRAKSIACDCHWLRMRAVPSRGRDKLGQRQHACGCSTRLGNPGTPNATTRGPTHTKKKKSKNLKGIPSLTV